MNNNQNKLNISTLSHTWIFDVDGTLVKHNGHLKGGDVLLDGVKDFFENLDSNDKVVLLTARKGEHLENLKLFLKNNNIRYDHIICDMPMGERILVNDRKPSGLNTAYAINKDRDAKLDIQYVINEDL